MEQSFGQRRQMVQTVQTVLAAYPEKGCKSPGLCR